MRGLFCILLCGWYALECMFAAAIVEFGYCRDQSARAELRYLACGSQGCRQHCHQWPHSPCCTVLCILNLLSKVCQRVAGTDECLLQVRLNLFIGVHVVCPCIAVFMMVSVLFCGCASLFAYSLVRPFLPLSRCGVYSCPPGQPQ